MTTTNEFCPSCWHYTLTVEQDGGRFCTTGGCKDAKCLPVDAPATGTMSPEAQRIAIAEACGRVIAPCIGGQTVTHRGVLKIKGTETEDMVRYLPDYLNDLNAMHEAEKVLKFSDRRDYVCLLSHVMSKGTEYIIAAIECYRATAAQRAEAFLRTLGLWKPDAEQATQPKQP